MNSTALFGTLQKATRGLHLARDEPIEIVHQALKNVFQNGCMPAVALRDEYLRLAQKAQEGGRARPHRHARDTVIVRVGATRYNLGTLLAWCYGSGPVTEDSSPTGEELCLQ